MKRRGCILSAALLTAVLLSGCSLTGGSWTPQEDNAISVSEDGQVTETVRDSLDQAYYDAAELEEMISSSVEEYNGEHGEDSVEVLRFREEDKEVTLQMRYASAEDYAEFNNLEFYSGSIINAQLEGYLFDCAFYQVEDGAVSGQTVGPDVAFKDMSARVLIVQAPLEVHLDGTVTFISTNAELLSADTVNANGVQTGEESYSEMMEANRVYIIYE